MEVKVLLSIKKYQPEPQISPSIWMTLGLPSRGSMLHNLIREGLPFEYLKYITSLPEPRKETWWTLTTLLWMSQSDHRSGVGRIQAQRALHGKTSFRAEEARLALRAARYLRTWMG